MANLKRQRKPFEGELDEKDKKVIYGLLSHIVYNYFRFGLWQRGFTPRLCLWCGKPFLTNTTLGFTCSPKCLADLRNFLQRIRRGSSVVFPHVRASLIYRIVYNLVKSGTLDKKFIGKLHLEPPITFAEARDPDWAEFLNLREPVENEKEGKEKGGETK